MPMLKRGPASYAKYEESMMKSPGVRVPFATSAAAIMRLNVRPVW